MAKQTKEMVGGGSVTVRKGITVSPKDTYSSYQYGGEVTLPMEPGESPKEALDRAKKALDEFYDRTAGKEGEKMIGQIVSGLKAGREHGR